MNAEPVTLRWPDTDPVAGDVRLRPFTDADVAMAVELSTDPYVPTIGTLPARATEEQAQGWIDRQRGRPAEGAGFSVCVADRTSGRPIGSAGLWTGVHLAFGRATAGFAIAPSARHRHAARDALRALTSFGWSIEALHRIELYIEPWNVGSRRTAEAVGYQREGLLRSHQEIGGQRRDLLIYATLRLDTRPDPSTDPPADLHPDR